MLSVEKQAKLCYTFYKRDVYVMENILISKLSFFNVLDCHYTHGQVVDYSSLARPFNIIGFVQHGEAVFTSSDEKIHLKTGDCFFIPLGETYVSEWFGEGDLYITCIFFYFDYESNPLQGKKYHLQKIKNGNEAEVKKLFIDLRMSIKNDLYFKTMMLFYTISEYIFKQLSFKETPEKSSPIQNALYYLHTNFSKPISIHLLAELCFLSESRFMHVFKEMTGMTAIAYKNELSIKHALRLLQMYPEMSVEKISERCGFSSSIYFRRVFQKQTGLSPREYKKKIIL